MRTEPANATQGPIALDLERASDLPALLEEQRLPSPDEHGIVRLPVLLGGSLLAPADVQPDEVLNSVAERSTAEVGSVVVVREPLLDRSRMGASGQRCFVMPRVEDPDALIVDRPEEEGAELRSVPLCELASQIDRVGRPSSRCPPPSTSRAIRRHG